jgi:hypothetical protein
MTTRTDEVTTLRERVHETTPRHRINERVVHRREERSEVKSFSEPEAAKPLVAFEPLPVPAAPPLTW